MAPVPLPSNSTALRVRSGEGDVLRRPSGNKAAQLLGQDVRPVPTFTQSERASDMSGTSGGLGAAVSPVVTSHKASKILGVDSTDTKRASDPAPHEAKTLLRLPRTKSLANSSGTARSLSFEDEDRTAAEAKRTFGRARPRTQLSDMGGSVSSSLDGAIASLAGRRLCSAFTPHGIPYSVTL